jgi:hypothetical protein
MLAMTRYIQSLTYRNHRKAATVQQARGACPGYSRDA